MEIIGLESRQYAVKQENMSCINVTDGYNAEILSEALVVRLRGSLEQLEAVRGAVDRFVGEEPQFDDLTMLSFEYKGPAS